MSIKIEFPPESPLIAIQSMQPGEAFLHDTEIYIIAGGSDRSFINFKELGSNILTVGLKHCHIVMWPPKTLVTSTDLIIKVSYK